MSDNDNPLNNDNRTHQQKADELGVPLIPPTPKEPWNNPHPGPNPTVGVCGQCGIELKGVMSYFCPHPECPLQTKTTM